MPGPETELSRRSSWLAPNRGKTGKDVHDIKRETLQGFVDEVAQEGVIVYTDEHGSHVGPDRRGNRKHETVNLSKGEYANECAGVNRMESDWAALKTPGVQHPALSLHQSGMSGIAYNSRTNLVKSLEPSLKKTLSNVDIGARHCRDFIVQIQFCR